MTWPGSDAALLVLVPATDLFALALVALLGRQRLTAPAAGPPVATGVAADRMSLRLRVFAAFWYDFVIGDDWRVAVGVAAALAVTWALSHATTAATWWIAPLAVVVLLPFSIYRATRRRR